MVSLALALTLVASHRQGDIFDADPKFLSIEFANADVARVLRGVFRHVNANFAIESGVQGGVNLSLKDAPFSIVLNMVLNQVFASSNEQHGVFIVEDTPNAVPSDVVMSRKLPAYDFNHTSVQDALTTVFKDARVKFRHPAIKDVEVGRKLPDRTLSQVLEILLPLASCKANYTHGHFELMPELTEWPPGYLLGKTVHGIDFIEVSAKDAFSTFFHQVGANYVLDPDIDRRFTLHLSDTKFENTLDILCQMTNTTYQYHGDVFKIERRQFQQDYSESSRGMYSWVVNQ
jgi:type II secretory pathway component GspD/PulD (secretin)